MDACPNLLNINVNTLFTTLCSIAHKKACNPHRNQCSVPRSHTEAGTDDLPALGDRPSFWPSMHHISSQSTLQGVVVSAEAIMVTPALWHQCTRIAQSIVRASTSPGAPRTWLPMHPGGNVEQGYLSSSGAVQSTHVPSPSLWKP